MTPTKTPLRKIREKYKQSLQEVANAIDSDVGNLSRIERGLQVPSLELAEKISRHFKGKITELHILYPHRYVKNETVSKPFQKGK